MIAFSFILLNKFFHHADIASGKLQILILPEQTGQHTLGIPFFDFRMGEIGADDAGFPHVKTGIDQIIQTRRGELIGQLRTEVVNDQKIAGKYRSVLRSSTPVL